MVRSTQIVHLSCMKISTISKIDRIKLPLEPCHLGVPSGASKMISELMVCLAQTVHLSCTYTINLQTDQNEILNDPRHLGVLSGVFKTIFEPVVRSAQTVHLSSIKISTISNTFRNEHPLEPHHLGLPSGASKK
jgi:hypothetical protein